jgi:hypothetical protein
VQQVQQALKVIQLQAPQALKVLLVQIQQLLAQQAQQEQ